MFKSHWPHCDISSQIGFTRPKSENSRCKSKNERKEVKNQTHTHYSFMPLGRKLQEIIILGVLEFSFFYHIDLLPNGTITQRCKLIKLTQNSRMKDGEVVELLKIANEYLPRVSSRP